MFLTWRLCVRQCILPNFLGMWNPTICPYGKTGTYSKACLVIQCTYSQNTCASLVLVSVCPPLILLLLISVRSALSLYTDTCLSCLLITPNINPLLLQDPSPATVSSNEIVKGNGWDVLPLCRVLPSFLSLLFLSPPHLSSPPKLCSWHQREWRNNSTGGGFIHYTNNRTFSGNLLINSFFLCMICNSRMYAETLHLLHLLCTCIREPTTYLAIM